LHNLIAKYCRKSSSPSEPSKLLLTAIALTLIGCSTVSAITAVANIALDVAGIKKNDTSEIPESMQPPRTVTIGLHAGENLNADAHGRPLAIVAKIYKLRQNASFKQASYEAFLTPQKEKEMLGFDLLEVKEITLIPGQRYQVIEKVTKEANFIGIVALFHSPAATKWRIAFASSDAEQSGITVGVHACALTVGVGTPAGENSSFRKTLSSIPCS
jgi:type VI secretion system protein VasD